MVVRSASVKRASASLSVITTDSLPMFSPLSVGLASNRVPVPDTPYSTRTPSSLACLACTSRTRASACASGVPGGSLAVISKRSCASCGIRSVPSSGTASIVNRNAALAASSTGAGRAMAFGNTRR